MSNTGLPSLAEWQAANTAFSHRGHPIFCRVQDAKDARPCLLLIHGFPTASWDWHKLWAPLSTRFRLVTADMIGFGFSAKPRDYSYSLIDQADLFEALLADHGIDQVHLLAHDYGDSVAQELLARHVERRDRAQAGLQIISCCFLNGGLFPETHRPTWMQRVLHSPLGFVAAALTNQRRFERSFMPVFGASTRPSRQELDDFWALIDHGGNTGKLAHKLIRYMAERKQYRERWVHALQNSDAALRVIDGAADPVSGAHMVARYRELVPSPDTVLLDGIGHYPQTEAAASVLTAFLAFHERLA